MAKEILIKKPFIDIDFKDDDGELIASFKFDKSDNASQRILDTQNEILKELALAETDDEYTFNDLKDSMRKTMDNLLTEGAFDTLYKISPSWEIMLYYIVQICKVVADETNTNFNQMDDALAKYVGR